jgi:trehalose 6-phosphate phosphatase
VTTSSHSSRPNQITRQILLDELALKRRGLLIVSYEAMQPITRKSDLPEIVPELRDIMDDLRSETHTHLVIISDRQAEEVRKLLNWQPAPEIWGCHGLQRLRQNVRQELFPISECAQHALSRASSLLDEEGLTPATELRHGGLVVRWNSVNSGNNHDVRLRSTRVLEAVASGGAVILSRSVHGIELRDPHADKATAVVRMLDEYGHRGCVAYIGCDSSDEGTFRVVKSYGLGIVVRTELRPSAADVWLPSLTDLARFLSEWSRAARGEW